MRTLLRLSIICNIILSLCTIEVTANTLYVKPDANSTAWQNQSTVYTDLQEALAIATTGDEIWIASGTYFPTGDDSRIISFDLKNGVQLYGGFVGIETSLTERNWNANPTVLSGNIGDTDLDTDNSLHVLTCLTEVDESTIINGCIIEKGYAKDGSNSGGGLYANKGEPLIVNCIFRDNYANYYGGAICINAGAPTCANTAFYNNSCGESGGAIYQYSGKSKIQNCVVTKNHAFSSSGGIDGNNSGMEIFNSIIYNNTAANHSPNINDVKITYSCIEDGYYGTGNISTNPMFVNAQTGDFRLDIYSPCINKGNNDIVPTWLEKDFAKAARILDNTIDMGIFEGGVISPILLSPTNNAVIKGSETTNEIHFTAGWKDETPAYNTKRQFIEIRQAGEPTTSIELTSDLSYTASFNSGTQIFWRVAVETEDGFINYSQESTFSLTHQHPLFVKQGESGDGTSWSSAYGELTSALSEAVLGDEIWVATGTYHPTNGTDRTISFELKNKVNLYGGFIGNETARTQSNWNNNKTILSGNIGETDSNTDNSMNVLTSTTDVNLAATIEGFIIEKGYNKGGNDNGAGCYISKGAPTFVNVIFRDNYADDNGGAIWTKDQLQCTNTIFVNNSCSGKGGAVYNDRGKILLMNTVLFTNSAALGGGGLYTYNADSKIVNSIIWNNTSTRKEQNINDASCVYSCIEGGLVGIGNISTNPLFIDAYSGDFRINSTSPCVNTGINDSIPQNLLKDFGRNNRIQDKTVDMGCFEGGINTPIPTSPTANQKIKGTVPENNLTFSWKWDSEIAPPTVDKYIFQYWKENEDTTTVELEPTLSYQLSLSPANVYNWRVGGVTGNTLPSFSTPQSFTISANHPLYVKEGETGNGSTWDNAYGNLQTAISSAVYGDEIWVASGTYKPASDNNRETAFELKNGVKIHGGFVGTETNLKQRDWNNNQTILSGNIGDPDIDTDNSFHVLTCTTAVDSTTLIDGLTIEKGHANDEGTNSNNDGAALYITQGTLSISNCTFRNNSANDQGGAIFNGSEFLCANSLFYNNSCNGYGGAINNNRGKTKLINCVISKNHAENYGAIYYDYPGHDIINCIIYNNTAVSSIANTDNMGNIQHTCIEGGNAGIGNIGDNPKFVNAAANNFRLLSNSPCINAGINDSIPEWINCDQDNYQRIAHGIVDMGANEAAYPTPLTPIDLSPERPDTNGELSYTWTLENITNGSTPTLAGNNYNIVLKVWEKDDPTNVFVEETLNTLGYTSANFDFAQGYQWKVGVKTIQHTYWSNTSTFYVGIENPLFVKHDATGTGDGTSWTNAYTSITTALNNAIEGDEIWVAGGTYKPTTTTNRETSFLLSSYIGLYGGFAGTETSKEARHIQTNKTILSGNIGNPGDAADNSKHVVKINGTTTTPITGCTLDGFTIESGNADAENGGGILCEVATPKILNCIITNNKATNGGGIAAVGSSPFIYNSLFYNNETTESGGAINADDNSKPHIINCTITKNSTGTNGDATIGNTIIFGNTDHNVQGTPEISYSCIEGDYQGESNTAFDPAFNNPANNDYRLGQFSACYNKGNNILLPTYASLDLSSSSSRILTNTVDIGAYEFTSANPGIIEVASATPSNNTTEVDYSTPITITFNNPVSALNWEKITVTPGNLITDRTLSDDGLQLTLGHEAPFVFDQTYNINIPEESFNFRNNDLINFKEFDSQFTIRACESGTISLASTNESPCPHTQIIINSQVSGDINSDYLWTLDAKPVATNDGIDSLLISTLKRDSTGLYSCSISDMCGNQPSATLELQLKQDILLPIIKQKWDDVLFVDNSSFRFDQYQWRTERNDSVSSAQYISIDPTIKGSYSVSARDSHSGCIVYSEVLTIDGTTDSGLLTISPNPVKSSQMVTVTFGGEKATGKLLLRDLNGVTVFEDQYKQSLQYNLAETNLQPGIYLLEVTNGEGRTVSKLIITK